MMAENTDVNVTENRQSKDFTANFKAENTSDNNEVFHPPRAECVTPENTSVPITEANVTRFQCYCHEVLSPNQRPMICRARWGERAYNDMLPERKTSTSSINSFDSGYALRICNEISSPNQRQTICSAEWCART